MKFVRCFSIAINITQGFWNCALLCEIAQTRKIALFIAQNTQIVYRSSPTLALRC